MTKVHWRPESEYPTFALSVELPLQPWDGVIKIESHPLGEVVRMGVNLLFVRALGTTPETITEAQPLISETAILAYCGRVDNREAIAFQLGKPELLSRGDGEILLAAYDAWGPEFLPKILGDFACVVLDRREGRLVAARDAFGCRTLFYSQPTPNRLLIGQEIGALCSLMEKTPSIDREGLAEYLSMSWFHQRTPYQGVFQVLPGQKLTTHSTDVKLESYWSPDPHRVTRYSSDRDYDDAFRELLFTGVRAALRSRGHVWTQLSGGLDSSTISAVAYSLDRAGFGPKAGLSAFSSVVSISRDSDESRFRDDVLRLNPLKAHQIDDDQFPEFKEFRLDFLPSIAIFRGAKYRKVEELQRELKVTTILTGVAGDQLFLMDFSPNHLADLFRHAELRKWRNEMLAWNRAGKHDLVTLFKKHTLDQLLKKSGGGPTLPDWVTQPFAAEMKNSSQILERGGERTYIGPAAESSYRDLLLTAGGLQLNDDTWDSRHPFYYRPLVEFMLSLPWEQRVRPGVFRVIQRRAMRGLVPDSVLDRTDKTVYVGQFLRNIKTFWESVQELGEAKNLSQLEIVDREAFRTRTARGKHGYFGPDQSYFTAALALEAWLLLGPRLEERMAPLRRLLSSGDRSSS